MWPGLDSPIEALMARHDAMALLYAGAVEPFETRHTTSTAMPLGFDAESILWDGRYLTHLPSDSGASAERWTPVGLSGDALGWAAAVLTKGRAPKSEALQSELEAWARIVAPGRLQIRAESARASVRAVLALAHAALVVDSDARSEPAFDYWDALRLNEGDRHARDEDPSTA
jgi:hypothetical protein